MTSTGNKCKSVCKQKVSIKVLLIINSNKINGLDRLATNKFVVALIQPCITWTPNIRVQQHTHIHMTLCVRYTHFQIKDTVTPRG